MKMRYIITLFALLNIVGLLHAEECLDSLFTRLDLNSRIEKTDCDTLIDCKGYTVRVVKTNGQLKSLGLNLFTEGIKNSSDKETLSYIESALLAQTQGLVKEPYNKIILKSGVLTDFKNISPSTDCSISAINSKSMVVNWKVPGKKVSVSLPLGYDVVKNGNRTKIENTLIAKLKKGGVSQRHYEDLDTMRLEPYKADLYIYPGGAYLNKDITSNIFLFFNGTLTPVWSKEYPLESIADMFLYPSTIYEDSKIEVKVLKHEYGESETFTIPLSYLWSAAESDGCTPYWGVESFENGKLKGALFLFNQHQGYDHVFSIECKPEDVIDGNGTIKARASLYIPTNNVDNLFQPYVKKSKNEKINYHK